MSINKEAIMEEETPQAAATSQGSLPITSGPSVPAKSAATEQSKITAPAASGSGSPLLTSVVPVCPGPSSSSVVVAPKRKFRDIAKECMESQRSFLLCNIDPKKKCTYKQDKEKYDSGNFIRHLRVEHPEQAMARGLFKNDIINQNPKKKRISKTPVAIDKATLVEALIKMVSLHSLPLKALEWEGFRLLLDPICTALDVVMNRRNLLDYVNKMANILKEQLAEEMQGRLVNIQMDSASRHHRHVLGISASFFNGQRVITRTLGMVEVKQRQTAKFIKESILELLQSYGIVIEQIFAVTCDNGANMVAAVKQLQQQVLTDHQMLAFEEEDESEDSAIDAVAEELQQSVSLIRCAVHTIQLAVTDVIKATDPNIKAITAVVNKSRKISYKNIFELHNVTLAPLYSRTRWGGVYSMLEHIKSAEDFYKDLGKQYQELDLTAYWKFIDDYLEALKPIYICTKNMQAEHVSLAEFYVHWLRTVMQVRILKTNDIGKAMVTSLTERLQPLMRNPAFKAALLVDPRFNYLNSKVLSAEDKDETRRFVIATSERINKLRPDSSNYYQEPEKLSSSSNDLDDFLTDLFGGLPPDQETTTPFIQQLNALDLEKHQSFSYDTWQHWMDRRVSQPQLSEVALLILAVPSNQVQVERSFSAMALVLSNRRTTMAEDTFENILLLKLNGDLIEKLVPDAMNL